MCPSSDTLARFLTSELAEEELERIAAHLTACEQCRSRVESSAEQAALADDVRWAALEREKTPVDVSVPAARLSELLPDYELVEEIGRGGMGVVYKARQLKLNRVVALKVLPALLSAVRPDAAARFRREAELAGRLKHSNIIAVHDFGEVDGTLYYAMEYVEGRSLAAVLREIQETGGIDVVVGGGSTDSPPTAISDQQSAVSQKEKATRGEEGTRHLALGSGESDDGEGEGSSEAEGTSESGKREAVGPNAQCLMPNACRSSSLPRTRLGSSSQTDRQFYRRVAGWAADLAEALDYAHGHGIIHRDVKPANVLLTGDGRVMMADFGLARAGNVATLTAAPTLLGTARYMSPEQVDEERGPVDRRADVYGLGATMYELLAFRPMFAAADDREVLDCVLNKEPSPPRRFVRQVPRELETICLKAVEKDRGRRYATAKDLADDLRRWLLDLPINARRPSLPVRVSKFVRRRKLPVAAVALSVVLLIATGLLYAQHRHSQQRASDALVAARDRGLQLLVHEIEELLYKKCDFHTALSKAEEGLAEAPDMTQLHVLRANSLHLLNRSDEMLEVYDDLLARDPDNAAAHVVLATAYARGGDRDPLVNEEKAAYHREQFLRLRPESAHALFLQAAAEADHAAAIELLNRALEMEPSRLKFLYDRSTRHHELKQYQASLLDAERCVVVRPRRAEVYNRRGRVLKELQRHDDALRDYNKAIEIDPHNAIFWLNRASLHRVVGRFSESIADATEALRLDPEDAEAYRTRGQARGGLGDVDEGLADLEQAIKLDPLNVEAYLDRCLLYGQAGDWENVIADSTRVIQFNPDESRGYRNRAVAFLRLGQYDRAIADLTRFLQLEPNNSAAYRARAQAYEHTKQYGRAMGDYSAVIDLDPRSPADFRTRAAVYQATERHAEAIADLTRAIELEPDEPVNLMMRGMIHEVSGSVEAALEDYERAAGAGGPTGAYATLWRHILLRQSGQENEAAKVLASSASAVEPKTWTDGLFDLFAGELAPEDLLAAAVTDDERAEAYYYIARKALIDGQTAAASGAFAACLALNKLGLLETDFARALLKQLDERRPSQAAP